MDSKGRVHTFCHAVPGKWHIMGVMLSAGGSLKWFRDNLGRKEKQEAKKKGIDPYQILTKEASKVKSGAEGLIFLPYLCGERTPYPNPNARGVFFGLSLRHQKPHLIRAIMEGVAFGLRDSLEIIREMGAPIEIARASGGGARSKLWRQIQANVYNLELETVNVTEGAAFGAALLAGVGTGVYSTVEEACQRTIHITSKVQPEREKASLYEKYYKIYRSLYPALVDKFNEITKLAKEVKL